MLTKFTLINALQLFFLSFGLKYDLDVFFTVEPCLYSASQAVIPQFTYRI